MKDLLWIYLIGAVITKWAVKGSALDTNQTVIEWPLAWLNNPSGMLAQLQGQLPVGAAPSGTIFGGGQASSPVGCRCTL